MSHKACFLRKSRILQFRMYKNYCNMLENERTGAIFARNLSLIRPHLCRAFLCDPPPSPYPSLGLIVALVYLAD